jgi:hypothetical protein
MRRDDTTQGRVGSLASLTPRHRPWGHAEILRTPNAICSVTTSRHPRRSWGFGVSNLTTKTCARCGRTYEAQRAASRYCSSRCRVYACRDKAPAPIAEDIILSCPPVDGPFDPKAILESIASDARQPAVARVAACRLWHTIAGRGVAGKAERRLASLNERAIELMNGTKALMH